MTKVDTILHYMFFCHKLPERSFFYKGKQFPICARCTGILVGYILGILYLIFNQNLNFFFIIALFIPIGIDGLGQYYGYWTSTNPRRFLTGIIGGIATVFFLGTAITFGLSSGEALARILLEK